MPNKAQRAQAGARRSNTGFKRETKLTRLINTREERRSVLVITNGERTEVDYFKALREEPWITADKVTVKFEPGDPSAVVLRAAAIRDDNAYDEAWAVCDVDEYDVTLAIADANGRDVELTLSVPCFEVWLVMHLSEKCPGFNTAAQAAGCLEKLLPKWDKRALKFSDFREGVSMAVVRAKRMGDPPGANPSTAVWRLVESLGPPPMPGATRSTSYP